MAVTIRELQDLIANIRRPILGQTLEPTYLVKGDPIRLFGPIPYVAPATALGITVLSPDDYAIDCRNFNAAWVEVYVVGGASPSFNLYIQGANRRGGIYSTLSDPNATQLTLTAGTVFDVAVGAPWVKAYLTTMSNSLSVVVIITPYVAAGQTRVNVTNVASQNLTQINSSAVSQSNGLPVNATNGTWTDRSGTITTGGTAQTAAAANTARRRLFIQNVSTRNLWFNFGVAAVQNQPSILLTPNQYYDSELGPVSTESVSVITSTTADPFTCKEM